MTATGTKLALVTENEEMQIKAQQAQEVLEVLKRFRQASRFSWWELGEATEALFKNEYWKVYDAPKGEEAYHSANDFVQRFLNMSDKSAYRARALRRELEVIGAEVANTISLVNAGWLLKLKKRLGESKWCNPKTIEAAVDMSEAQFTNFCQAKLPGAAKEELTYTLKLPNSFALHAYADTMKIAQWLEPEIVEESELVEFIFRRFCEAQMQNVTVKITNETAYIEAHKSKGKKKKGKKS